MSSATSFVLKAGAWIAVLFGVLRLDWVQEHLMVPWAGLQQDIACALTGAPRQGLVVDQSCTGSDAMALCLGAILAFPAPWKRRLIGAGMGLGLVLAVNTVRIGQLSYVVGNRDLFRLLHLYVWPAVIVLAAAAYVFWWMHRAGESAAESSQPSRLRGLLDSGGLGRFLAASVALLTLYYLLSRWWLDSAPVQGAALAVARTAGGLMGALGLPATVDATILRTPGGAWRVTAECVTTPLIPIYLAGVLSWKLSAGRRLAALLAVVPLFFALATARLLVLALPAALVGSPVVAVHAFYQLLAAALLVAIVAHRSAAERTAARTAGALAFGAALALPAGLLDLRWLRTDLLPRLQALHLGHSWADAQGTLGLLPAFGIGLLAALWWAAGRPGGRRLLIGRLALLAALAALTLVAIGEAATHLDAVPPVVLLRAWSLALPVVLLWDRIVGWRPWSPRPAAATSAPELRRASRTARAS